MSDDTMEDVKPRVGPIPLANRLQPSVIGKNTFKVDLLVYNNPKKNPELMLPFQQLSKQSMSIGYYIATTGLEFSLRVKLTKPAEEGNLYGARVYIGNGKAANKDLIYRY
jgi:hypothetical protein